MAKIGDTVRYLNQVGGGRIIRIEGKMAWVDDDGFETPVLLSECVVVRTAEQDQAAQQAVKRADPSVTSVAPQSNSKSTSDLKKFDDITESSQEIIETPGGDTINIVIGFEPTDRTRLSQTDFDASLINDSNYFLYFTLSSRDDDSTMWTCRYAGIVEPNTELWLGTFERNQITYLDKLCLQYIAFKRDRDYNPVKPESIELSVDTTKFFKLHCYTANPYFDNDVLAFTFVKDGIAVSRQATDLSRLTAIGNDTQSKKTDNRHHHSKKDIRQTNEPLVVDLHIDALLDTPAGMSKSDMLNYQVDTFQRVMNENLRNYGRKIIFIHGKGEGVLRQALMKELTHRYKGHDVQDASFQEYGYGATQVTIRQHPAKFNSPKK